MALVLSERDYKMVTLITKIAGIFTFSAGTIMLVDHGSVKWFFILVLTGIFATLAPLPMTVIRPDTYPDDEDMLTVDE